MLYFRDGVIVAESNDVRVYNMEDQLFLEIGPGHNLWALESESVDYIDQLHDRPHGHVLEIGLGLGVASKYILSCPRVKSLTTVEVNSDVIKVHDQIVPIMKTFRDGEDFFSHKKHLILNIDGLVYAYQTKRMFDFIFIDCYERIDDETLPFIADLVSACRRIVKDPNEILGWFDKFTPEEYEEQFFKIFKE